MYTLSKMLEPYRPLDRHYSDVNDTYLLRDNSPVVYGGNSSTLSEDANSAVESQSMRP